MGKIVKNIKEILLIVVAFFAIAAMNSCSKGDSGDGMGEKGFAIVGAVTDANGVAQVSCDGRAKSISLVFKVRSSYVITTSSEDWITISSGESGEGGDSRTVKLKLTDNLGTETRGATIYIEVDGKRNKLAVIMQSNITIDAIVKKMDTILAEEYYWLDAYKRMQTSGKIDYTLTGQNFLDGALLNMGSVNLSDGYYDSKGVRHLFSYIKEYSATRASEDVDPINGFGIELCYTIVAYSNGTYGFLIEHVYPDSPADLVGLKRGDEIVKVNSKSIDASNYSNLFNTVQGGMGSVIDLGMSSGANITLAAGGYYESPVACCMMLEPNPGAGFDFGDKKIGYISYLTFDHDYDDELVEALQMLDEQGATDVVVDLRKNGGGHVISSAYFASMLLSEDCVGKTMVTLTRHKDNKSGNTRVPFYGTMDFDKNTIELPHLGLNNVYFITSKNTASASELLIMGLRAQGVNAVTVGTTSMGKDCGMDVYTMAYGGKYYEFAPITFMNLFDNYNVNFADGIIPDVDFETIMNSIKDEDLKDRIDWYPLPEQGAAWGDYLFDIALGEAVANILGGTIFPTSAASARFSMPQRVTTRSAQSVRKVEIEQPEVMGMFLTEADRKQLEMVK